MSTATMTRATAHERFKNSFWSYVWAATAFSALAHFALLDRLEFGNVPDYSYGGEEMEQIALEDQSTYEIPPPPAQIARPAVPVISTNVDISTDITIGEVRFDDFVLDAPAPPPTIVAVEHSDQPSFTPYEIRPTLVNGRDVQDALLKHYPPTYKSAGIGGVTTLWIYIDETGDVKNTKVVASSGFAELDAVAERVMREAARFSPAYNRDMKVPVWIQMPVTFEARVVRTAG